MKSTGIVRRVDELGRVVLPVELRRTLGIEEHDPVEILMDEDHVVLKRYQPTCVFCRSEDDLLDFRGKRICRACIAALLEQEKE